ncbi:DUF2793 domain-containing protein [Rhizobium sp. S-51]|uniref:DUF2793 domain-containing protein n=1 Tax=Rhizobium terricola TaxID=2728849 RepID=A0A7Y0ASR6_9HYPH|nr:DUF2793 domain-containing protein [Rhizobium terricola]NML72758.1 DUF2793 domain-containing protein [Rhizobium terricola]
MSDTTINLALPYILPSQAQKHVTHNEALQALDAIVQLTIAERRTAPPEAPVEGRCYWVTPPASGDWSGKEQRLAFRQDDAWIFVTPRAGWRGFEQTDGRLKVFSGTDWLDLPTAADLEVSTLGLSTTADAMNRLAVRSPASLFTHDGSDHRMKLNKAATDDTASLLLQSGWQGKAEIGLAGEDRLSIKVSPDGSTWTTALVISPDGIVRADHRPLARASLAAATFAPAAGTETGFDDLIPAARGFTLGAPLSSGHGSGLLVPVSGVYQLHLTVEASSSSGHAVLLRRNGTEDLLAVRGGTGTHASTALAQLDAGDTLTLLHAGSATLVFGRTATELSAAML